MFGLVLWSDPKRRKALIWCEDQSDLAYFDGADDGEEQTQADGWDTSAVLNVGDALLFDICQNGQMRRATNLRALVKGGAEDLTDQLKAAARAKGLAESPATAPANVLEGERVLRFPNLRRAHASASEADRRG